MVKAVEKGMRIEGIRLLEKTGGKSGTYRAEGKPRRNSLRKGEYGVLAAGAPTRSSACSMALNRCPAKTRR